MSETPTPYSVEDVRPIAEVIEDIRTMLVRRLPGNTHIMGCWTTVNECDRMIDHANAVLKRYEAMDKPLDDVRQRNMWLEHGHKYAATSIVRRLADELKVPNMYSEMK